ncbi:MAG: saccharopine dehydrogenase [Rhodothermales bacterium]|nr:saccharopine dehydrogenase [Rhodothermales bacterium]
MNGREFDIVLWGASGFTGRLVAEYLVRKGSTRTLQIALGGRSRARIEEVRDALARIDPEALGLPLLVGDGLDRQFVNALAARSRVVCTTVGPYDLYGRPLVAACASAGTHYCDLTGEVPFIRDMIDAHHQSALASGAMIVHSCGFDSVPSDLGVMMLQDEMHRRTGLFCKEIILCLLSVKGGVSGGTVSSMLNFVESAIRDSDIRDLAHDPYALNPSELRYGPEAPDATGVRFNTLANCWTAPFLMGRINTRVVRRTNALLDDVWGREFLYSESVCYGSGRTGMMKAWGASTFFALLQLTVRLRLVRSLLKKTVLPKPGEGPSATRRAAGNFEMRLTGRTEDEMGEHLVISSRIRADTDPGYSETAKMLAESALCLAQDDLSCAGGVLTPAAAMGPSLLARLQEAGLRFEIRN